MSDIIELPLTKGHVAIIDRADEHVAAFKWHASVKRSGNVYGRRSVHLPGGGNKLVLLHRYILGDACIGFIVDHIDGNGLNNRRSNLRTVSVLANNRNVSRARIDSASGVLGVCWHARDRKWQALIRVDGRRIHLGCFPTIEQATAARLAAEAKYWGIQPRRAAAHAEGEIA